MIWLLIGVILILVAALVAGIWVVSLLIKRIDHFEFELENRDRQSFRDIAHMFRQQEQIDILTQERDNALRNIEMLIENDIKRDANFEYAMELVLNG